MREFDAHDIRFRYPGNWTLVDESSDEKIAVTVQSDGTVFWTIAVFPDAPQPDQVVESAVAAYREDYPELDVYPVEIAAGPHGPIVRRDVEFVCLELIAAARIESYRAGGRTVMVLMQGTDSELDDRRPVLDAMTASLDVAESGEPDWPDELLPE